MAPTVHISARALREIDKALGWLAERSRTAAVRWHEQLLEAVRSLENNPERCGLAPESAWYPGKSANSCTVRGGEFTASSSRSGGIPSTSFGSVTVPKSCLNRVSCDGRTQSKLPKSSDTSEGRAARRML